MNLALKGKCSLSLLIGLGLSLWLGVSVAQAQCPNSLCYVDASVTLTMTDGMSWTTAYTNLQDALAVSRNGDEIWVAAGVYYPDEGGGQTNNNRGASFAMKNGVEIYGGFAGTETLRSQRQPRTNLTVLSGDIDGNDITDGQGVVTTTGNIRSLNAYNVIRNIGVGRTAVLDGFTITAGNAEAGGISCPNACGGGMYNSSSHPKISQVSFSGNSAASLGGLGGGMSNVSNSNPEMRQVSFSGNFANQGGGMVNWNSNPEMRQVSFSGNSANQGGGMYNTSGNPKMSQVSFSGNFAGASGGGMFNESGSNPEMSQVSFSGNSAASHGGGMFNSGSSPHIVNSIFWRNAASGVINVHTQIFNGSSNPVFRYTLIQGSGGSGLAWVNSLGRDDGNNLDADPLFQGPINPADAPTSAGNLRLRAGSPAIDVGDNSAVRDEVDLAGAPRIQGVGVDLGAYEVPGPHINLSKAVSPAMVDSGQRVTYTLVLSNSGLVNDSVRLSDPLPSGVEFAAWGAQGGAQRRANEISWQGPVTAGESITITFAVTNLISSGIITNTAQFNSSIQQESSSVSHIVLSSRRLYVDAGVTLRMTDGLTWTSAYTNLQDALAEAIAGDEIWVAAGVYYPDEGGGQTNNNRGAFFRLKNGVEIYGGFAATETQRSQRQPRANVTVLSGDIDGDDITDSNGVVTTTDNITGSNAYHVIWNIGVGRTAVLDGFTITAGYADAAGASCPGDCGGGMYNSRSNPEMSQVSFSGNFARLGGGGMLNNNSSNPKMSQVSFSGNSATDSGGGMFNSVSNPEMSQVSFSGNRANNNGGGMYNESGSHPEMSQVSFSGNSAALHGGGMFNTGSSPHIVNSIFWGNAASGRMNASAQIHNLNSTSIISSTLVQGSGGSSAWDNNLGSNGGNNLDADPLFREPIDPADAPTSAGNLRLEGCSPAIDVGDNRAASGPQDLEGAPRIQGRGVDLGAYESRPVACISLSKAVSPVRVESGQRVTYTLALSNSGLLNDSVRLSDTLPSGVEFAAWGAQGGAVENANEISWQGPVTAGESITITFGVTTPNLKGVIITNTAQFSSSRQTGSISVSHTVLKRLYVDAAVTLLTMTDGLTWTTAYTNLQDALAVALAGDEIWVAKGVYYPDEGRGQTNNDVTASFALTDGVEIYGGFAGTETLRSQRQPRVNVTVLSGDIDRNDGTDSNGVVTTTNNIMGTNARHVIFNSDVNSTAVLDGFTITAGDVDVTGFCAANNCGGGMYNIRSSPEMSQIRFIGNRAGAHGGGMVNWDNSHPKMSQISFSGNSATHHGGGMLNDNSRPEMSQVSFSGNRANIGGGMFNQTNSNPKMSQVSFSGNSAVSNGGGMFNAGSSPHIINSIFWGNAASGLMNAPAQIHNLNSNPVISYTLIQGSGGSSAWLNSLGMNGGNNLDADPLFQVPIDPAHAPTSAGNLRLKRGSPAIDAGDDRAASGPLDLDGAPRIQGGRVDLGAYEAEPLVSLSKAVSPVMVEPDQRVTYTLVLSNSGVVSDTVRLSDTLPSGVEFAAWGAQGGGVITANEISWQGPVTAGESITITFLVSNLNLSGPITNRAQFSGSLQAGSSSVSHTVLQVAPLAADDTYSTDEDTRLTIISPTGVLSNDGDRNGDMLTATVQSDVSRGTLDLQLDGSFVYTPAADVNGLDYFSYQVSDGVLTDTASVTITIRAVNDAPVAAAGADQSVRVSQRVSLDGSRSSDIEGDALGYGWQQTGGARVTLNTPSLSRTTFTAPAVPTILTFRLSVTDEQGLVSRADEVVITVTEEAIAGLRVQNSSPAALNEVITFTASITAGDNVTYRWDFGEGGSAVGQEVTYFYLQTGTYTAKVEASNSTNRLTATTGVTITDITERSVVTIAGLSVQNSSPAAVNEVITFTANIIAGDNVNYIWDFGDGFRAVGQSVSHVYTQAGRYTATVLALNSINSLTATTGVTITDEAIAGLSVQNSSPAALNEVITFTASITAGDNVTYTWHFGDGGRAVGQEVSHVYTEAGTYIARVVVSNSTNTLTATTGVTVTEEAIAGLRAQNSSPAALNEVITFTAHITAGERVNYTWDFGDGGRAVGQEVTYLYLQTGTYTAKVEASNSTNRLTATTGVTITDITERSVVTIAGLTVQNSSPAALKEVITFTANITAGDNVNYRWDFGDGFNAVGQRVTHVYTEAGRYTATVLAINSINRLTATTGVTVTEEAIAGLSVQNSSPAALNEVVTFTAKITAGEGVNYRWDFGDGFRAVGQEVTHVYTEAGTYIATVVVSNSSNTLTATTRVRITDEAIAGLSVQNSSPAAVKEVITFTAHITAGTNVSYTWDFGDGEQVSGTSEVSRVYPQAGTYTATVEASNSTNSLTATTRVTITDEAIAGLSVQNSPVTLNEVVTFTAHIAAGTNVNYIWDFGDGGSAVGQTVPHVYTQAGTYTVRVEASNSINTLTATTVVSITPSERPEIDVTDYLNPDLRLRYFTAYQGVVYSYIVKVSPSLMRAQTLYFPATQVYMLSAPQKPAWLDFVDHQDNTGTLRGVPGAADRGEQAVTILATDGQVSSTAVLTIRVEPNQVYLPLVFK